MAQRYRLRSLLVLIGVPIGLSGICPGGAGSGPPVEIVLPDGYTGPVYLIEDEKDGTDIPLVNGRYLVEMPATCRMRVRSLGPFQRWHKQTLRYASGTGIPDAKLVPSSDPAQVMERMSNCGTCNGGPVHIEIFVGTDKQVDDFIRGPRPPLD